MKAKIKTAMTEAMKQKDKETVELLRRLLSAIQYEEIATAVENLSNDAVLAVIKKELKKSREELEFAEKADREDLIKKIKFDISTLEKYLPTQLGREELSNIIREIIGTYSGSANIGLIMKALKEKHAGQYDGKLANEVAQEVLRGTAS